jgi:glycosyltransferase involved in cell wall biosynthesis
MNFTHIKCGLINVLNFHKIMHFFIIIRKSKNIFFLPYYHTGGAERVHLNILEALKTESNLVIFTNHSYNDHFLDDFKSLSNVFELREFCRTNFLYKAFLHVIKYVNNSNIKYVFGCNNYFFYKTLPFWGKSVIKADLTHAFSYPDEGGTEIYSLNCVSLLNNRFVINNKTKEDFKSLYFENNIDPSFIEKINVLSIGIDISHPYPHSRKVLNSNDKISLIYIGRIAKEKRLDLVIEIGKQTSDIANLEIYGPKEIEIEGIEKYYKNNVDDVHELNAIYTKADILLITSYREGFPLVIKEAMCRGVVCISTNVGSISEHISHGINGFLINSINDEEIIEHARLIINDLYNNKKKLSNLSLQAMDYAIRHFDKIEFQQKIQEYFRCNNINLIKA